MQKNGLPTPQGSDQKLARDRISEFPDLESRFHCALADVAEKLAADMKAKKTASTEGVTRG